MTNYPGGSTVPREGTKRYRILVPRLVDAENRNAQNLNAKAMLARFDDAEFEWHAFSYNAPDPAVVRNETVTCHPLMRGRLWPWHMITHYARFYDAVFYPGSEWHDAVGMRLGCQLHPKRRTIATLEGLRGDKEREEFLSTKLSRPVYCDRRTKCVISYFDTVRNCADHIVAISPFLEAASRALYATRASTLPLGFETASGVSARPFEIASSERPLAVGAGTVYARKRPEIFVDLAKRFPNADFMWFGDGPMRSALQRRIASENIPNLEFPGAVDPNTLRKAFCRAFAFVLPSLSEGVPKVSLEAASCGLPIILFGHFETPTVRDGENGYTVFSDEALGVRLGELLSNPALAEKLGAEGRRYAEDFSWDRIAPQWLAKIRDIVTSTRA